MKRIKWKFTLMELLITIAIIAILASIVLPALHKALERARTIKCSGNLKQTMTSLLMYADDNQEMIPVVTGDPSDPWTKLLFNGKYITWKAMMCPSITKGNQPDASGRYDHWASTYGVFYHESVDLAVRDKIGPIFNSTSATTSTHRNVCLYLKKAKSPTITVCAADTAKVSSGTACFRWRRNAVSDGGGISNIHIGRMNLAFLDGHVKNVGIGELKNTGNIITYYVDFTSLTGVTLQ